MVHFVPFPGRKLEAQDSFSAPSLSYPNQYNPFHSVEPLMLISSHPLQMSQQNSLDPAGVRHTMQLHSRREVLKQKTYFSPCLTTSSTAHCFRINTFSLVMAHTSSWDIVSQSPNSTHLLSSYSFCSVPITSSG